MGELIGGETSRQRDCNEGVQSFPPFRIADWRFNSHDISSWAQFSGDFNPVHFCPESAQLVGSADIIVHGMLPLVYVKQVIADTLDLAKFPQDWLKVSCRFRSPMKRDQLHELTIASGRTFVLRTADDRNRVVLEGSFEPRGHLGLDSAVRCINIAPEAARERLSQFAGMRSDVDAFWIALDSLVFSELIASDISLPIVRQRRLTEGVRSQVDLLKRAVALQTTHSTVVSRRLLLRRHYRDVQHETIQIKLGVPDVVRDTPDLLVGSQPADVFLGSEFAMRCEIGFMFRRKAGA